MTKVKPLPSTVKRFDNFDQIRSNPRDMSGPPPIPTHSAPTPTEQATGSDYIDYEIKMVTLDNGKTWIELYHAVLEIVGVTCDGATWYQPILRYADGQGLALGNLAKTADQAASSVIVTRMRAHELIVSKG